MAHSFWQKQQPKIDDDFDGKPAFFSCWALWMLFADKSNDADILTVLLAAPQATSLRVVRKMPTVHHLGLNPSRAWGLLTAYHRTKERHWYQAYKEHLLLSEQLTEQYQHDRYAYTHWVPQFIVYAIWLEHEKDRLSP